MYMWNSEVQLEALYRAVHQNVRVDPTHTLAKLPKDLQDIVLKNLPAPHSPHFRVGDENVVPNTDVHIVLGSFSYARKIEAARAAAAGHDTPDPSFTFHDLKDIVINASNSEEGSEYNLLPDLEERLRAHMTLHLNSENSEPGAGRGSARTGRTEKFSIEMGPSVKVDFSLLIQARNVMLALRYPFTITDCDVTVYLNRINIRSFNRIEVKDQESALLLKSEAEPPMKKIKM